MRITILDKHGWPVERVRGRPIQNALRMLIHGRRLALGKWTPPRQESSANNQCAPAKGLGHQG